MFEWISYSAILTMHVTAFAFNIILVIAADLNALRWVMGWKRTLDLRTLRLLHYLLTAGLTVSIASGAYLFSQSSEYLLTVPAFYTKMLFVLALIVNAFVIGRHMHVAAERSFESLLLGEKIPLFISGAVSTVSWIGVFVAAQFLGL